MNTATPTSTACAECLEHSHLISRLAAWIQNYNDDRPGRRAIEILQLPIEQMIETIGVNRNLADLKDSVPDWDVVLEQTGVTAICQHDGRYPQQLLDAPAPPKVLFCRGNTDLLGGENGKNDKVAIVGARKATGYGLECAATIGRGLAQEGQTVVSGMALGIDGAAHRGALEKGRTIAVLACGPDRPYPASHSRLYRQIIEHGLVISEQEPGADAWRWTFPARNRIIAALAGTTVVVEAATRSGSLMTAHIAHEIGRDVCAVPGPITSGGAAGPNDLIARGKARLITGPEGINQGRTDQ